MNEILINKLKEIINDATFILGTLEFEAPKEDSKPQYQKTGNIIYINNFIKNGDIHKEHEDMRILLNLPGVSVDSKPRKDGRWQGRITVEGVQKSFYGKTREEVLSKVQGHIQTKQNKNIVPKSKVKITYTLHSWLDKWFSLYKAKLKPLSQIDVQVFIKGIKEILPDKDITRYSGLEIQEALEKVSTDYKRKRIFSKLNEAFKKAEQLEIVKRNPCVGVEPPKYRQPKKRALNIDEQATLIERIKGHKFETLYFLMLTTGLRVGEALALTKADITPDYVVINKNVVFVDDKRIIQDTTKTAAGVRKVILPKSTYKKLEHLLQSNNEEIFFTLTSKYVSKVFSDFCNKIGIKGCSLHSLRHTYSTRISEAGIPPKVRQYLLGHANLNVTENVYTDTQEKFVDAQKDSIDKLF